MIETLYKDSQNGKLDVSQFSESTLNDFEEYDKFFHRYGDESFAQQRIAYEKLLSRKLDVENKILTYYHQLITVMGVVAGFGFTSITNVKSIPFFIIGELILIGTIVGGMYWLKRCLSLQFYDNERDYAIYQGFLDKRGQLFHNVHQKYITTGVLDPHELFELRKIDTDWNYADHSRRSKDWGDTLPFLPTFIIFILGAVLIMLSIIIKEIKIL